MIDFACKHFSKEEVMKCSLGLTKAEMKVFLSLGAGSSEEVAQQIGLDVSTVQRALKKLHEKGVVTRRQSNLDGGGYVYQYAKKNKEDVNAVVLSIVKGWVRRVEEELMN